MYSIAFLNDLTVPGSAWDGVKYTLSVSYYESKLNLRHTLLFILIIWIFQLLSELTLMYNFLLEVDYTCEEVEIVNLTSI